MATKPIPPGTVQLTVNCPKDLVAAVDVLARRSKLNRSQYVRGLLERARDARLAYTEPELRPVMIAAEDKALFSPRPPVSKLPAPTPPARTGS